MSKHLIQRGFSVDANDSVWAAELPPERPGPTLAGEQHADVAIVGAGLAGLSTAWHLLERFPERRIVVLEAHAAGNGASGRSGGQALTGIHGIEPVDDERLRRVYEVTRGGIDLIEHWVGALDVADAGFKRTGSLEVATTNENAGAGHARVERWRRAGIPLRWIERAALPIHGACGAVLDPAGARLNPLALTRALAVDLRARGVDVFERSPVMAIEGDRVRRLRTSSGAVSAPMVVIAAAAYAPSLGFYRGRILPLHSHVVATAPIEAADWASGGWGAAACFNDDRDRVAYGTRTPRGRLLFGGGDNAAYDYRFGGSPIPAGDRRSAFAAVESRLRSDFPALAHVPIEHRWTGAVDLTLDRVCSIGADRALGFSGHGIALAALAGRVIADLHAGDGERWRDLPFVDHVPPWLPPEPLRWIGYQLYTRLTGRSPRRRA